MPWVFNKSTCGGCGGSGSFTRDDTCNSCGRRGSIETELIWSNGHQPRETCSTCDGSGSISSERTCGRCHGTGEQEDSEWVEPSDDE